MNIKKSYKQKRSKKNQDSNLTRFLFNMDYRLYLDLIFIQIGARDSCEKLTKAKLMSLIFYSSFNDNLYIPINEELKKISDLHNDGMKKVFNLFNNFYNKKSDMMFYNALKGLELEKKSEKTDLYLPIIEYVLSENKFRLGYNNFNCDETIFLEKNNRLNDKLGNENIEISKYQDSIYETDDYIKIPKSDIDTLIKILNQHLINLDFEVEDDFRCIIDKIIKRYRNIDCEVNYIEILTDFIFREFNSTELNKSFEFIIGEELSYKSYQYDTLDFIKEFFNTIESKYGVETLESNKRIDFKLVDIRKAFGKEDSKFLTNIVWHDKIPNDTTLDYSTFDMQYYMYPLIKEDLLKILNLSLSVDFKYIAKNWTTYFSKYRSSFNKKMNISNSMVTIKVKKI